MQVDDIITQSGLAAPQVAGMLTILEMKNIVRRVPGNAYIQGAVESSETLFRDLVDGETSGTTLCGNGSVALILKYFRPSMSRRSYGSAGAPPQQNPHPIAFSR